MTAPVHPDALAPEVNERLAAAVERGAREALRGMIANPKPVRARLNLLAAYERLCARRRAPDARTLLLDLRYVDDALEVATFVARLKRKDRRRLPLDKEQTGVVRAIALEVQP